MSLRLALAAGLLASTTALALAQTAAPGSTAPDPAPPAATPTAPSAAPAEKPAATPAAGQDAKGQDTKDLKEWQAAKLAKISVAQALATAQTQGEQGGKAIDVDFEKADGKNPIHYAIKVVYPSGKLVEYGINADTGELYKSENQPIERYFTFLKTSDFNEAKLPLKDALTLAEQTAGGGKAYEAEVEREGKAVQYTIKVAGTDGEKTVKIGPDGKAKLD